MKRYFLFILLAFTVFKAQAQDPNWSLNTASYQYSMTFTAFLNIDGSTLSSSNDKVAAFVGADVRGVATVTFVPSFHKYVAYLTVYANTSNETISFKIYDATSDKVIDVSTTQEFIIDGNIGSVFQSYSIANPPLSSEAVLNSFAFVGLTPVSQTINDHNINVVLPTSTDISNLTAIFSISAGSNFYVNNQLQVSGSTQQDFTSVVTYDLLSENEAVMVTYKVNVSVANTNSLTVLLQSDAETRVNQAPILVTMQTNTAITNFDASNILLTNAVVSSVNKVDELNYAIHIVPIQQGGFSIQIPENKVFNEQGETNLASNKLTHTYDLVNPYIVSIRRKNPIEEITNSTILEFEVVFSEDVKNVVSTDFISIPNATITLVKASDSTYFVTVKNNESTSGVLSLNIKSPNTIQDKASNLLRNVTFKTGQN